MVEWLVLKFLIAIYRKAQTSWLKNYNVDENL